MAPGFPQNSLLEWFGVGFFFILIQVISRISDFHLLTELSILTYEFRGPYVFLFQSWGSYF